MALFYTVVVLLTFVALLDDDTFSAFGSYVGALADFTDFTDFDDFAEGALAKSGSAFPALECEVVAPCAPSAISIKLIDVSADLPQGS